MLTIEQLVTIETQSSTFPLHVRDLHKKFGPGPLSLRSIISKVEAQKAAFFVQIRDTSILKNVNSLAQLQAAWRKSAPSKATLDQFSQILSSTGGSIVYLSRDWQTVGITGTTASLASLPATALHARDDSGSDTTVITGLGMVTGSTAVLAQILMAAGAGPLGWVAIVGIVATELTAGFGGYLIGNSGLFEIFSSDPAASLPQPEPIVLPEITIYGQLPPDVPEENVITLPTIDMNEIPLVPPQPPPNGNGGSPSDGNGGPPPE